MTIMARFIVIFYNNPANY